jgi:hypothetical protein
MPPTVAYYYDEEIGGFWSGERRAWSARESRRTMEAERRQASRCLMLARKKNKELEDAVVLFSRVEERSIMRSPLALG